MKNDIINIAIQFSAKYYPESKVVILAGSQADYSAAQGSDIDLALTSPLINEVVIDTFHDFNTSFDVVVFPEHDIEMHLHNLGLNQDAGPILSYLAKGRLIKDDIGIGKHIIAAAEHHFYKGYHDTQSNQTFFREKTIKKQYDYLSRITDETDRIMIVNYIVEIFSGLLVMVNFGWHINPGKWRIKLLKLIDNDFYQLLGVYYKNPLQQEQALLAYIKDKLYKIIDDYHKQQSYRFDETVLNQHDHLIISFTTNINYFEFIQIVLLSTDRQNDKFYFYTDKQQIIIVFFNLKDAEQNLILSNIRHNLNANPAVIYSCYTLNYPLPKIHYGGTTGFDFAEQTFSFLCSILHQLLSDNKINLHNNFAYAGYFYIVFFKSLNFSKEAFKEFSDYLYKRLSINIYDTNFTIKYKNITDYEENIIANFEKIYHTNKEKYTQIFGTLLKKWKKTSLDEDWLKNWSKNIRKASVLISQNTDLELSYIRRKILAESPYLHKSDQWLIYEKLLDTCFNILSINANDRPFLIYVINKTADL